MSNKSWDGKTDILLKECPFCGAEPEVKYIGNDYTKTRKIKISCPNCRINRFDASRTHSFDWVETVAAKNWNKRI